MVSNLNELLSNVNSSLVEKNRKIASDSNKIHLPIPRKIGKIGSDSTKLTNTDKIMFFSPNRREPDGTPASLLC